MYAFTDLALATYCPRKLYYRRRDERDPPDRDERHELAFRYPELFDPATDLSSEPIAVSPHEYRATLGRSRARVGEPTFEALCSPEQRDVTLRGRQAHGVAHKVCETPLAPSLVVAGNPPEQGVWEPQSVRAVAMAKALSWEREVRVERAFVEYAAHGVVREIELTARRTGQFRRALHTARAIDGPPRRTREEAKCEACEYASGCGVKTRSLRSLLG